MFTIGCFLKHIDNDLIYKIKNIRIESMKLVLI